MSSKTKMYSGYCNLDFFFAKTDNNIFATTERAITVEDNYSIRRAAAKPADTIFALPRCTATTKLDRMPYTTSFGAQTPLFLAAAMMSVMPCANSKTGDAKVG